MSVKIVDISQELYLETGEPSDISIPAISFWIRTNIGKINNLLDTSFTIDDTTLEIDPDITTEQTDIFKKLYHIYYLDRKIRSNLGAGGIVEVSDDGGKIRFSSSVEKGKAYLQLRKDLSEELKTLLNAYRTNNVSPIGIHGKDYLEGIFSPGTYETNGRES